MLCACASNTVRWLHLIRKARQETTPKQYAEWMTDLQDEAAELIAAKGRDKAQPQEALAYLSQHCDMAVVTLGDRGCIAQRKGQAEVVQEPACSGVTVLDATGLPCLHQRKPCHFQLPAKMIVPTPANSCQNKCANTL